MSVSCSLDLHFACRVCFCFKQKTAYEMRISDWSSDVCSSDLSPSAMTRTTSPTVNTWSTRLGAGPRLCSLRYFDAQDIDLRFSETRSPLPSNSEAVPDRKSVV